MWDFNALAVKKRRKRKNEPYGLGRRNHKLFNTMVDKFIVFDLTSTNVNEFDLK